MLLCATILCLLALADGSAVPPLSDEQRARLMQANDGGDHQEEAFLALLENVRSWPQTAAGGGPPSIEQLLGDPSAHRGEIYIVRGLLAQKSALDPPIDGVEEWFVRADADHPMLVYIVEASGTKSAFRAGDRIETTARFYKRVDSLARDGRKHSYAAFVGGPPRIATISATVVPPSRLVLIAVPVGALLIVFTVLMLWVRRSRHAKRAVHRSRSSGSPRAGSDSRVDSGEPLPDDPAEALAELKRRAESPPHESHAPH